MIRSITSEDCQETFTQTISLPLPNTASLNKNSNQSFSEELDILKLMLATGNDFKIKAPQ
jgi:hypothetical protein